MKARWDPPMIEDDQPQPSTAQSYLQLLRAPNLFTAIADVTMGFLFVQAAPWEMDRAHLWTLGVLAASSVLLYAAGVVLNDVFDLAVDRQERPERPIPSGRVSLRAARWLGGELLLVGWVLPWVLVFPLKNFRIGIVASLLAAAILFYDAVLKRTPLGPLAMGACRMLNVLLGMSVLAGPPGAGPGSPEPFGPEHWVVAGAIGVYVAGLTWLARNEAGRSPRWQLLGAGLVMLAGVAMLALLPLVDPQRPLTGLDSISVERWYLLVAFLGAMICWRCLWAVADPQPQLVQMAVAQGIMSLVFLDAVACFAARGLPWAAAILALLVPIGLFSRWIRAT
jgi:hypothetical protein